MGKLYNRVMNKWLNYFTSTTDKISDSLAFKEGYDDPTYLTFKVEFGDWGASILDRPHNIEGTTSFAASKSDYDALPIGLLNCPYEGIPDEEFYWQNDANTDSKLFNEMKYYSAFQYLRSRNEDVRAKYLLYFVNGLYEILSKYPFLFKKISGLDGLELFDPKAGQRIKNEAKITLECYEGLNLKIRTLMEFYRKAAWDDHYQKWILPENMRQFKMIVYVFERRTFLDVVTEEYDCDKVTFMKYGNLNAEIPVKAYECCPCEFDIAGSLSWKGEYSADMSGEMESSKICIKVSNVKTYFKNGLLSDNLNTYYNNATNVSAEDQLDGKISLMMIYDLVESIERTLSIGSISSNGESSFIMNATVNQVRQLFLNKDLLLENEDNLATLYQYIWGHSVSGAFDSNATSSAKSAAETVKDVIAKRNLQMTAYTIPMEDDGASKAAGPNGYSRRLTKDNIVEYIPRAGWVNVLVDGPTYDEFVANLGNFITNIFTGARQQVLISGSGYNISMDSWKNMMMCLCPVDYLSAATEKDERIVSDLLSVYHSSKLQPTMFEERVIPTTLMQVLDPERTIPVDLLETLDPERIITPDVLAELEEVRELPELSLSEVVEPREIPEYSLDSVESPRIIPDLTFDIVENPRVVPDLTLNNMGAARDIPTLLLNTPEDLRELPEYALREPESPRDIPSLQMKLIEPSREIPDQAFKTIEPERNIPELQLNKMGKHRKVAVLKMAELELIREVPQNIESLLEEVRKIPGFNNVTLDDIRELPKLNLIDLKNNVEKAKPSYKVNSLEIINSISKATEPLANVKLIELDKNNIESEKETLDMLKENMAMFNLDESKVTDENKKQFDLANFTKIFVDNSESIKEMFADNIVNMRQLLISLTKDSVRNLPEMDLLVISKDKPENEEKNVMMSLLDMEQIDKNIPLMSLDPALVKELSFLTLIQINKDLEEKVKETLALVGLTKIVKEDNDKKKTKLQQLQKETESKEKNKKLLTLEPPREIKNRHVIL